MSNPLLCPCVNFLLYYIYTICHPFNEKKIDNLVVGQYIVIIRKIIRR